MYFVFVDAKEVVSDFDSLIKTEQWKGKLLTKALLILDPSKTADIQQMLAYGGGLYELIVWLLNASV